MKENSMNEKEKNAIEEFRKQLRLAINIDDVTTAIRNDNAKTILNLIEKLQKENEELKVYNNSITSQLEQMTTEKFKEGWIHQSELKDFIPVQKVKDKIEELEEELEIMKVDNMYGRYKEYGGKTKWERLFATKYGMHDALQELLEGREENEC